MACRRIQEKGFIRVGPDEGGDVGALEKSLRKVTGQVHLVQSGIHRDVNLLKLNRGKSSLLQQYLSDQITANRRRFEALRTEEKRVGQQLALHHHLRKQYQQKGEAVSLVFTICSNIQVAKEIGGFVNALFSVAKEIDDVDRYQIRQKLQGGKLRVYVEEYDCPGVSLLSRWVGAMLDPRQLSRHGPEFEELSQAIEAELMVLPARDVMVSGSVKDEKKLVTARIVRNFLKKLEVVPTAPTDRTESPESEMPIWIGNLSDGLRKLGEPWELPLDKIGHTYISGSTGSGKSYLARVIVEGCSVHRDLGIVILDPRNQWVGLLCPEDRPEILGKYESFGLERGQARSFGFDYHAIAEGLGKPLPSDLRRIPFGRHIISFKGLDDLRKYTLSAEILKAILEGRMRSESRRTETVVIVEEVPNFMKKTTIPKLRSAAERVESAIDRIACEGRKYGISLVIISQTIRDFSYGVAIVRQNMSTRVFMRNSDREIDYASQHLDDGKAIVKLRPGEAFFCNPEWGVVRISVRPPFSKVWEPSDGDTRRLVGSVCRDSCRLSQDARAVVDMACEQYGQTGKPAKLASIAERLGITSRRKLDRLVKEIEDSSIVRIERLNQRGRPIIVAPVSEVKTYENRA
ncbi:DUF87 domain-containing protein [candidate division KSB1 bacterium]|nr:DUF87 domain-containing protein [candidate division KSB1 bacterium]